MEQSNTVKLALIVGGSRGIGRSLVEQFAEHGWRVIEASRNAGKDEANILHDHVDLSDVASIDAFVNAVGPLRLAKRLLPLLREDGLVAFTTSVMASMATYDSLGLPLYRASKAAFEFAHSRFLP